MARLKLVNIRCVAKLYNHHWYERRDKQKLKYTRLVIYLDVPILQRYMAQRPGH